MKLFIPTIGTKLHLTIDWQFTLHPEHRNERLYEIALGKPIDYSHRWGWEYSGKYGPLPFHFPGGTTLIVDRIYIRKGSSDFDSITFRIPKKCGNHPLFEGLRFWVKLADANTIEADVII